MDRKNLLTKYLFLLFEAPTSNERPRAPSQAPNDTTIRPSSNQTFITRSVNIQIKISSNLKSIMIRCFWKEKFKKQQKITKNSQSCSIDYFQRNLKKVKTF